MLIRDVPEGVLAPIDARAAALGVSRNEYLRRRLSEDARRSHHGVAVAGLARFEADFADLADLDIMNRAWDLT